MLDLVVESGHFQAAFFEAIGWFFVRHIAQRHRIDSSVNPRAFIMPLGRRGGGSPVTGLIARCDPLSKGSPPRENRGDAPMVGNFTQS